MPIIRIESGHRYSQAEQAQLTQALYEAVSEGLSIPNHPRHVIHHHSPDGGFAGPAGAASNYAVVTVVMFAGRSAEVKQSLCVNIAKRLKRFGIPADQLFISLIEQPKENWGMPADLAKLTEGS